MGIIKFITQLIKGKNTSIRKNEIESGEVPFIWCLVGNIIDEHFEGEEKILRKGTKHFRGGCKVYCYPPKSDGGLDKVKVLGKHRKSKRTICVVMPTHQIKEWQLQKVTQPYIVKMMQLKNGWTNSEKDKEIITDLLLKLQSSHIEN